MRKDFDGAFSETSYRFSERERTKLASFPFDKYPIWISTEREANHFKVLTDILVFLIRN
jgi:hypothetical protein